MKVTLFAVVAAMSIITFAGPTGLVIKGALKTWDEIAKIALKVSGKSASDDAVKAAAKTLSTASGKYGDDVAEAAMHGGIEVAEQTVKHGGGFAKIIGDALKMSPTGLREIALHSDDVIKFVGKYGDDVLRISKAPGMIERGVPLLEECLGSNAGRSIKAIGGLSAEDIPRTIGAIEKNKSVARLFAAHVERFGTHFVDQVFKMNRGQIMAGTLGAAAIVAAVNVTKPYDPEGPKQVRKIAEDLLRTPEASEIEKDWAMQTIKGTTPPPPQPLSKKFGDGMIIVSIGLVACMILFVVMNRGRWGDVKSAEGEGGARSRKSSRKKSASAKTKCELRK